MTLLGLTGPIGHGKTSLADAFARHEPNTLHIESSQIIREVANQWQNYLKGPIDPYKLEDINQWIKSLPAVIAKVTNVPAIYENLKISPQELSERLVEYQKLIVHIEHLAVDSSLAHQTINDNNKQTYRPLLQWLGGYLVQKVNTGIWFNEIIRRIEFQQKKGLRLAIVGGLRYPSDADIIRSANGYIIKIIRPGYAQADISDPTERQRENIQPHATVINDGSVGDLALAAKTILADISDGKLQEEYAGSKASLT